MDTNQRQIALSVLESLREDLVYAHLNNGRRILDVADLRQYLYEQMSRIRTNAFALAGLYGNHNGHGQDGQQAWSQWGTSSLEAKSGRETEENRA